MPVGEQRVDAHVDDPATAGTARHLDRVRGPATGLVPAVREPVPHRGHACGELRRGTGRIVYRYRELRRLLLDPLAAVRRHQHAQHVVRVDDPPPCCTQPAGVQTYWAGIQTQFG